MFPRVTAILVVQHGGDHLRRTIAALQAQRRTPDALVIVLTEADPGAREIIEGAGATHIVEHSQHLAFGEAVRAGERVLEAPSTDADALWLLSEDSAPEPDALAKLLATLETAKSVGIAGPKLMHWDAPDRIAVFGRSITRLGRSVPLVADELDQGQHDGLSDVLGLDPAAILVRHTVWRALDGFDPGLPTADDALDFSIRAASPGIASPSCPRLVSRSPAREWPDSRPPAAHAPCGDASARPARQSCTAGSSTPLPPQYPCTGSACCRSPCCAPSGCCS